MMMMTVTLAGCDSRERSRLCAYGYCYFSVIIIVVFVILVWYRFRYAMHETATFVHITQYLLVMRILPTICMLHKNRLIHQRRPNRKLTSYYWLWVASNFKNTYTTTIATQQILVRFIYVFALIKMQTTSTLRHACVYDVSFNGITNRHIHMYWYNKRPFAYSVCVFC